MNNHKALCNDLYKFLGNLSRFPTLPSPHHTLQSGQMRGNQKGLCDVWAATKMALVWSESFGTIISFTGGIFILILAFNSLASVLKMIFFF